MGRARREEGRALQTPPPRAGRDPGRFFATYFALLKAFARR